MQAIVVYSSCTGNTQKIATHIFTAIPGDSKDMQRIDEYTGKDADVFFVGFWTDKGDCDSRVAALLTGLHGRKIALFGTCGMGTSEEYYGRIEERVRQWLPADNRYIGAFFCQGKMPMQVRKRYERMLGSGENTAFLQSMIRNFDEALLHPDREDEEAAEDFARNVMAQSERL
ncbi:MAG: flavodoxin family protein [Eubacteriales bacterium]|nr:flavodoxin family protein [Eubacteriales bacterium]